MSTAAIEPTLLARVRAWGLGEQALKTAIAAGLAWMLGGLVPGAPPSPYLAPLTAMLTVQLTITESIRGAVQRTLGATLGVVVAVLAGSAVGVNPITVALLVLLAQSIGGLLRLTSVGTSQVMVSALLVLTVGSTTPYSYPVARVVETVVGAVVGLGINALFVPPSHLPSAIAALSGLGAALSSEIEALANGLAQGLTAEAAGALLERARETERRFESAHQTLQLAEDSLRFNLRGARQRQRLDELRGQVEVLERSAIQVRAIARGLSDAALDGTPRWLQPSSLGQALADLLHVAARLLEQLLRGQPASLDADALARERSLVLDRARSDRSLEPDGWLRLAGILATLDRLLADLAQGGPSDGD